MGADNPSFFAVLSRAGYTTRQMTEEFSVNGTITAITFVGDGSGLTGITRATLGLATPNYVVINSGTGAMSEEQFLATSRGGFGLSTAAFTGVGKVAAGVWSASAIVNADVDAAAAIARTKLASGTANHVLINTAGGVMSSEAQLNVSRGGTGQDFSGVGAGPFVVSASSGVLSATVGYGSATAANTIVQRDASQNFVANQITAATIAATANLALSPAGGFVDLATAAIRNVPTGVAGSLVTTTSASLSTANATPTTLYTLATTTGTSYIVRVMLTLSDTTGATNAGSFTFFYRVKNIGGTVTNSAILSQSKSTDGGLSATAVTLTTATTNSLLQVTGIAATTIKWAARVEIAQQAF